MTALNRQIKGELSDAELDSIAGGASAGEIVGYVSIGLIPAAIAAIWDCYLLQRLRAQLHSQRFLKEVTLITSKEFFDQILHVEALCQSMEACRTPEEAYAVAKEAGVSDGFATFTTFMTEMNQRIKCELSDAELDNITGGASDSESAAYVISGATAAGATAIAA